MDEIDRKGGDGAMLEAIGVGRKADERWLLDHVSLSLAAGQRLVLVGPTGSGKSLLLRSLAMLDPVDAGEIRWFGKAVGQTEIPAFRSRVLYLHQRPALIEGTVEENLRHPLSLRIHRDKTFDRAGVVARLEMLGRGESFLSRRTHELSGGESQLTALLRAIQLDPLVLLLDEPTAALDAATTEMVETLVGGWLDEERDRRSAVWVTHNEGQSRRVSTSILHIREGRLTD